MKSLKRRFELTRKRYPDYSDFLVFAEAIKEQNFKRESFCTWFTQLVPKDDWRGNKKEIIMEHLVQLTKKQLRTPTHRANLASKRLLGGNR